MESSAATLGQWVGPVLDLIIEWLQLHDPVRHLPLWFLESQQPLECGVVGPDDEGQPPEVVASSSCRVTQFWHSALLRDWLK